MTQKLGSSWTSDVLVPSIPPDIGARTQRQRILEAMAKGCAEKTFAATTIADVVGHASISRATFYKHFANKRECFDAAADAFLVELREVAANAPSSGDSGPDAIRRVVAAVLESLAAKPAYANLLLVEAPNVDPAIVVRYRDLTMKALKAHLQMRVDAPRSHADPEIAFGRAKVLITDYLAAGQVEQLPSLLPELVYIALLPYLGQEKAVEQARLAQ